MKIPIHTLALGLLLLSFGNATAQEVPPNWQLPTITDLRLDSLDASKKAVYIGLGYKNGDPSDSLVYVFDGKYYPFWALEQYLPEMKNHLHVAESKLFYVLMIDQRVPFGQVSGMLDELVYLEANNLFWRTENGKGIFVRLPVFGDELKSYYASKRKAWIPKDRPTLRFSFQPDIVISDIVISDGVSIEAPRPKMAPPPPPMTAKKMRNMFPADKAPLIALKGEGELLFNDEKLTKKTLTEKCVQTLEKHGAGAILIFQPGASASFQTYINTYAAILRAYHQVWEDASIRLYNKKYVALSRAEQDKVKGSYPFVVAEFRPLSMEWEGR